MEAIQNNSTHTTTANEILNTAIKNLAKEVYEPKNNIQQVGDLICAAISQKENFEDVDPQVRKDIVNVICKSVNSRPFKQGFVNNAINYFAWKENQATDIWQRLVNSDFVVGGKPNPPIDTTNKPYQYCEFDLDKLSECLNLEAPTKQLPQEQTLKKNEHLNQESKPKEAPNPNQKQGVGYRSKTTENQYLETALHLHNEGFTIISERKDNSIITDLPNFHEVEQTESQVRDYFSREGQGFTRYKYYLKNGLYAIDIDCKNDDTGELWKNYQDTCKALGFEQWESLTIEQTPSKGFHVLFNCFEEFEKPSKAVAKDEKNKVLIEFLTDKCTCYPSPNYTLIQGALGTIQKLSSQDVEILILAAKTLNKETIKEYEPREIKTAEYNNADTSWNIFDNAVVQSPKIILNEFEAKDWKVKRVRDYYFLYRPDKKTKDKSPCATFGFIPNRFYAFSSSTIFEAGKAYKPNACYAFLNHSGNFSESAKDLWTKYKPIESTPKPTKKQETKQSSQPKPEEPQSEHKEMNEEQHHKYDKIFKIQKMKDVIFEAKKLIPAKQLFGNFWSENEFSVLFADNGVGKSILAVQIANGIASGKGSLLPCEAEPQKVLYYDFELSESNYQQRYTDESMFSDNFERVRINLVELGKSKKDRVSFLFEAMRYHIEEYNCKTVIIDNLTALSEKDLSKAENSIPLVHKLNEFKEETGISLLLLAHTPKVKEGQPITKNDLAGSKKLSDMVDGIFSIGRNMRSYEKGRYIIHCKDRNGREFYSRNNVLECELSNKTGFVCFEALGTTKEKFLLHDQETYEKLHETDEKKEKAIELFKQGITQKAIAVQLEISQGTVSKYLNKVY